MLRVRILLAFTHFVVVATRMAAECIRVSGRNLGSAVRVHLPPKTEL